ncbi:MAG: IS1595 family transposase [Thermodesulfobacteriota bacterium]
MENKGKNRYYKGAHVSERKFKELLKCFSLDITATKAAELTGISRPSVNKIYRKLRERIKEICEQEFPLKGEIEVDESYFGAKRKKGKRGRGSYGKTPVFGILERNGKVYTEVVPDCSRATLQGIIRGHVEIDSIIHSDKWRGYNGLVDMGYPKHYRIDHKESEFVKGKTHINGIESFWSFAKRRLQKYNGIQKKKFNLHLKESEFRFNNRKEDIYKLILKELSKNQL